MSFYSELTKAGLKTTRRLRQEVKHAEAEARNALTTDVRRRVYREGSVSDRRLKSHRARRAARDHRAG